jgi:hypothetical protein
VVRCSIEQIESALGALIKDRDLRVRMGENAYRLAQRFSPPTIGLQLDTAYAEIRRKHVQQVAV